MRKTLAAILAILFILSLCACGEAETSPADSQVPASSQVTIHTTASNESTTTDAVTTEVTTETTTEATTEDTTTVHTHSFTDGKCVVCGETAPDNEEAADVWIPTNGGKKYHKSASCSNMKNPEEVTKSEAESRGFTPCKKCYQETTNSP